MRDIHLTEAFKDWWSKPFVTQPSGRGVCKDYSMVCFIVSFRQRILGADKSYAAWAKHYTKFKRDIVLTEEDQVRYRQWFDKYDHMSDAELGVSTQMEMLPAV